MILYKNTKVKVRSLDGDTNFFDIVTSVLQVDTLAPYQFIICLDYVLRMSVDLMKENGFTLAKARSRSYPARTITDADYADDIALLANTPTQAQSQLLSLEQVAGGIDLHVNTDKTESMCFNQRGDISTLNGRSLKLLDKFIYLGSSVSSTENDIKMWQAKAWTAIDRLSVIWKSDLSDKIKCSFFSKQRSCQYCCMDAQHGRWQNVWRKSLTAIAQECCELYGTISSGSTPQSSSCTDTYNWSRKPSKLNEQDMGGYCWRSKGELISDVLLHSPSHGRTRVGRPARTYLK